MLGKEHLKEHQRKTSKFIVDRAASGGCMCWLDVGGGKTVSTLDAIATLSDNFCFNKCLVISTKRIVMDVWPAEIELWEQTNGMKVVTREQILSARQDRTEPDYLEAKVESKKLEKIIKRKGSKRVDPEILKQYHAYLRLMRNYERKDILSLEGDFYLLNVENYRWLVNTLGTKWIFDTQVFDESSLFRNSASKRFRAAKSIKPYVSTTIGLTGTPAPNGYMGLWAQCFLIDGGDRLGKTITGFRDKYFTKGYDGFSYVALPGSHKQIQDKIKDIVISLDPKDYMEIGPEPIHEKYKLQMPPRLKKQYNKLENEFFLEVLGDPILAKTEAVKANKLRQFCNGTVYSQGEEDDKRKVVDIHDIKIEALKEIVEISVGNPLIVAYEFLPEKDKILKKFPKAVTIDGFSQTKWDKGEIEMLLIHPRCLNPSTEVLTENRGWVKIIDVKEHEKVFDGVEFVSHKGCVLSGVESVIDIFGIKMTKQHKLLINDKWVEAKNVQNIKDAKSKAQYTYKGNDSYLIRMFKVWGKTKNSETECRQSEQRKKKILQVLFSRFLPSYDRYENTQYMEQNDKSHNQQERQGLSSLRWGRQRCLRKLERFQSVFSGYGRNIFRRFNFRSNRQLQRLLQRELSVGYQYAATVQQKQQQSFNVQRQDNALSRVVQNNKYIQRGDDPTFEQRYDSRRSRVRLQQQQVQEKQEVSKVYDLVDCGKRNRFLIRNQRGEAFISHNSGGHGLNLQHGGHRVVWFPTMIDLELYDQLNGRVGQLRQAQSGYFKAPIYYHLYFENTVEEDLIKRRGFKDATQKELIKAMDAGVRSRSRGVGS